VALTTMRFSSWTSEKKKEKGVGVGRSPKRAQMFAQKKSRGDIVLFLRSRMRVGDEGFTSAQNSEREGGGRNRNDTRTPLGVPDAGRSEED